MLRVSWRNLFSICAVVSVFGSSGKQVLVVHTTMYLEYHTVVVLCQFFWFWREIVFGVTYVLSVQYSCAVVSFFLLWRESFTTTGEKKSSSRLSGGLCCCVSFWFQREIGFAFTYLRTQSTIQLWRCISFWFWREIVFGVTYVLSVQYSCAVVSVFWLWWEIVL